MLRAQSTLLTRLHQCLDLGLVAIAFVVAYFIKRHGLPSGFDELSSNPNYYVVLLLCIVFFYLCFNFFDFYSPFRRQTFPQIFFKIVKAAFAGFSLVVLALYVMRVSEFSRLLMGIFAMLTIVLLTTSKGIIYQAINHFQRQGYNFRNVLVVGSKQRAREMIAAITQTPESGYKVLGCLEIDSTLVGSMVSQGVKVIGSLADFRDIILHQAVDEVVFAMPLRKIDDIRGYIAFAEEVGVNVRILPDWQIQKVMYRPETAAVFFEEFAGIPAIGLSSTPQKNAELMLKAAMDYLGAAIGLVILSPLMATISILIKLTSAGPIFFRQVRSGVHGRRFTLIKFRTMIAGAEQMKDSLNGRNEMDGPVFKITDDPRVTGIGRFLRKTSLDELPQLVNVLRGEMSLVGPRPPLPEEVEQYEPWQRRRLSMKPGLTCIWQVSARNAIDFKKWMKMDLEYIDRWSLLLDLKLLAYTFRAMVLGTGK